MAKKPAARAKPKAQEGSSRKTWVILTPVGAVLAALIALPTCVLLMVGLLPTIAAFMVDRHRHKYLSRTVGAMNLVGCMPGGFMLWRGANTLAGVQAILGNPFIWLSMYTMAGIGWLIYMGMPSVIGGLLSRNADKRFENLDSRCKKLIEEWGPEVAGGARGE